MTPMLIRDSKSLHMLEDWQPAPNAKGNTRYLALMDDFQTRIVTSAKKVALRQGEKDPLPGNFKRRIKENFVDTLCFLFDGILNSAMGTPDLGNRRPSRITRVSSSRMVTLKDIVRAPNPQISFLNLTCKVLGLGRRVIDK